MKTRPAMVIVGAGQVTIADAREKALGMRRLIDAGKDPIEERDREQQTASVSAAARTFEKAARQVHEGMKPGWKNEKHAAQWISALEAYVFPKLCKQRLDAITPADCADVLRPIWLESGDSEPHPPAHARGHAMGLGARLYKGEPG